VGTGLEHAAHRSDDEGGIVMKIGTIGIGAMGAPMARNLADDGHAVLAHDIDPKKVAAIVGPNLEQAGSVAEIARVCELIILMTPDDRALRDVVLGDSGILSVAGYRGCTVDLSTTSVPLAREIHAAFRTRGARYLDGAVIGGGVGAVRARTSPIMVSGDRALFDACLPVLSRLGDVTYAGADGSAKIVKICNNLLLGLHAAASAEALSLGVSAGLTLDDMVPWIDIGSGNSSALQGLFGRYVREGVYGEGLGTLTFYNKDMTLGCDMAADVAHPAFFAQFGRQLFTLAAQVVGGDAPFPAVYEFFRELAEGDDRP
jgi:3-hydroxyisobutyrate dehydrogenase-like beta-hydroxyacid dehydrogenase